MEMVVYPETAWLARLQHPHTAVEWVTTDPSDIRLNVLQAYAAWRAGEADTATELIAAAESDLRSPGKELWLARALNIKGCLLMEVGEAAGALACFQEQLDLAQKIKDIEMEGLAHNDIGVLRLAWDSPHRALRRLERAREVFEDKHEHSASLGLVLLNLSSVNRDLGEHDLAEELLQQAEALVFQAQAWLYWSGILSLRALRLAETGQLDEARAVFRQAEPLDIPNDFRQTMLFFQAKVEALHGEPQKAREQLECLRPWVHHRQDMLQDYLETRAAAEWRCDDPAAAYHTMHALLTAIRGVQARERDIRLRLQERQPHQRRSAELEAFSFLDGLTGISNRRDFEQRAAEILASGRAPLLALVDIDNFKQVNDLQGHVPGDVVLTGVATLIRESVRKEDVVARLGGDEFVVLRADDDLDAFTTDMQALCQASFTQAIGSEQGLPRITLSIGVTRVEGSLMAGLKLADRAMYRVKRHGKNGVAVLVGADHG